MKCLIVDDAAFMRMALRQIIETQGFEEIVEATNGQEAITAYQREKPDLVTMDLTMPEMDGLTAIRHLMEMDPAANIVVCSAMGQKEIVVEAIQAGAKSFIIKPFESQKVIEVVRAAIN